MAVKFTDNSIQVKKALNEAAIQWLEEAVATLQTQAEDNTPVDTGQLKGSWGHRVDEGKFEAKVGNTLENSIWTEFGTGEYALKSNGRKGAWYVPAEKVTGKSVPTYGGKVVMVYGKNGQKFYKTDGKRPVRMLHNSFVTHKAAIKRRLEQVLKGKMQ